MEESATEKISQIAVDVFKKRLDRCFVATIKNPLSDALRGHQFGPLQSRQMCRNRRLRQSGAFIDQAATNTQIERVFLSAKMLVGRFEPLEYLPPYRIGECFVYEIEVHVVYQIIFRL